MNDQTNNRKLEHIRVIQEEAGTDRVKHYFDEIHLKHRGLPELDLAAVDTTTSVMGKTLSFPLLISSMTGGDHETVRRVNRHLALAAESNGVAMGVGSQRVMFTHPEARDSFALREFAPTTLLFSNVGAVQLNYGFTSAMCAEAVTVTGADALYLHANPLQEAVQPEGNTNFAGLAARMGELVAALSTPVILKEVGAGISVEDAQLAVAQGIRFIDVAGSGGTSWSRIESHRHTEGEGSDLGVLFQDWGIPTPAALMALRPMRESVTLFASGGIRNGVDMAKAMILGASLCGIARPFLAPALESADAVSAVIRRLKREFKTAMFLLGAGSIAQLEGNERLLQS